MAFTFWTVNPDGTASPLADTPETCAAIDAGNILAFGNIEGAIIHGGVQAVAFKRMTIPTYDAAEWFRTGAMVEAGEVTETLITAGREHCL